MRPTASTTMQRTSDKHGVGGKSKAPPPPIAKHCTTINISSNGLRSGTSTAPVESRLSGDMDGGDRRRSTEKSVSTPSRLSADLTNVVDGAGDRRSTGSITANRSSKSSPAPPPPSNKSINTLTGTTTSITVKSSPPPVNGHKNGHHGSSGSSSNSSVSGGSVTDTDFFNSLPDLPPDDCLLPLARHSVTSLSSQQSFPPSPSTSGYSSPFPSPRTGGERPLSRATTTTIFVEDLDDARSHEVISNSSFNDELDFDAPIIPPPPQFGDVTATELPPSLPPSPPPSPPIDDVPQLRASEKASKSRPYSEADVGSSHGAASALSLARTISYHNENKDHNHHRDRPVSYAGHQEHDDSMTFHVNVKTTPQTQPLTAPSLNAEVVADPARTFAGRRDVRDPRHLHEKQIVSMRGTVRGFKNRVRAGINTFIDPYTNKFNYRELEKGKIVVYTTSMMVVRETYDRCKAARNMLQTHMVRYEERDLYMSHDNQRHLAERLEVEFGREIPLPQIFIDGVHVGGTTELEKLNESEELRKILTSFPKIQVRSMCNSCGGYRFVPCMVCHGSKKSVHRNNFTEEFCALRCMHCNENGLQRCQDCLDQQE